MDATERRLKGLLDLFSELQSGLRSPFDRVGEVVLSRQLGLNQTAQDGRGREGSVLTSSSFVSAMIVSS
jgi:hypothetical protein